MKSAVLITQAKIIAQPERRLIFEGDLSELKEQGRKKMRHLFLFNDLLICTQASKNRFSASTNPLRFDYKWTAIIGSAYIGPIDKLNSTEPRQQPFSSGNSNCGFKLTL